MERRSLLVSDLDGTLIGDAASLEKFAAWYDVQQGHFILAYSSGRFFDSVVDSIESTPLPEPDVVIGGVGTDIRNYRTRERFSAWTEQFESWDPLPVRRILASVDELELQPEEFQSRFKISYYAHDLTEKLLGELRQKLTSAGFSADLIYSSRRDLDIVPAGIDKGSAARFLANHWRLPADRVFVCGDSGNDRGMFLHGFRGVVVANAHADLKQLTSNSVYHAQQAFAAGVLEGIEHWTADQHAMCPAER